MEKIAEFLHRVGNAIVAKAVDPRRIPRIGAPLFDKRGRKVGIVTDVIGNVKSPYIVIKGSQTDAYFTKPKFLLRGGIYG